MFDGPWMLVSRHRGRGDGRGGAGGGVGSPTSRETRAGTSEPSNGTLNAPLHFGYARSTRGNFSSCGRGGHLGNRSRTSSPSSNQIVGVTNDMTFPPSRDMETTSSMGSLVPRNSESQGKIIAFLSDL